MECTSIQIKSMKQAINGRAAPATFIVTVSVMSDLTLTNGECEDRHGPKAEDRRLLFNTFTRKMSGSLDST